MTKYLNLDEQFGEQFVIGIEEVPEMFRNCGWGDDFENDEAMIDCFLNGETIEVEQRHGKDIAIQSLTTPGTGMREYRGMCNVYIIEDNYGRYIGTVHDDEIDSLIKKHEKQEEGITL